MIVLKILYLREGRGAKGVDARFACDVAQHGSGFIA